MIQQLIIVISLSISDYYIVLVTNEAYYYWLRETNLSILLWQQYAVDEWQKQHLFCSNNNWELLSNC